MNRLTDAPCDQGVRDLILENQNYSIKMEEIPFESQTREKLGNKAKAGLKLTRFDKKAAGQKSMPLSADAAQDEGKEKADS